MLLLTGLFGGVFPQDKDMLILATRGKERMR